MRSVLGLVLVSMILGCGSERVPGLNQPPTAKITGGPVESDEVHYRTLVTWTGEDSDGTVARFEVALDPADAFTSEEVVGGTLPETLIPGARDEPDTTRVSKVVGGESFTYDWVHTKATSRLFVFQTPDPESLCVDPGDCTHTGRHTGFHKLYVRAVDDLGKAGNADRVAFTAVTQVPTTRLVVPGVPGGYFTRVGPKVRFQFEGTDADGPSQEPVRYVYKFVQLPHVIYVRFPTAEEFLLPGYPVIPWIELPPGQKEIVLEFEPSECYAFGVRAVDEAGAIDPFLEFWEDAVYFRVLEDALSPRVVLSEPTLGSLEWPESGTLERDVSERLDLGFVMQCTAESYGEVCAEMRWGLDLADVEGDEGWSPWGPPGAIPPFRLEGGTTHFLYVQARDGFRLPEGTTTATLVLESIPMPFDREVLFVDDSRDSSYPNDEQHDAFWRDLFQNSGRFEGGPDGWFDASGSNDVEFTKPQSPSLELLGRYRLVVWENRGSGYDGYTALAAASNETRVLRSYLLSGGKLWVGGSMTFGAMSGGIAGRGEFTYLKDLTSKGSFAGPFLKIPCTSVLNDKGEDHADTFEKAIPARQVWRTQDTYPLLEVERDPGEVKLHPGLAAVRGISHCDATFGPFFPNDIPGYTGKLDSLYAYGPYGPSIYRDKVCASRWHDPDPARKQGRVQWFGFPLYYMKNEQAQEVFNRSIDWFREEQPPN